MATRKRKTSAQNSARKKRKQGGPGRPFKLGNPWRFEKGKSGNPGGRPRLLSDAYKEWLAAEDDQGVTNAAKVAVTTGGKAVDGDIGAVREIRAATEGTRLVTWRDRMISALRLGQVLPEELKANLGDAAEELLVAAGLAGIEAGTTGGEHAPALPAPGAISGTEPPPAV